MRRIGWITALALVLAGCEGRQRFETFPAFRFASAEVRPCTIGYRTWGELDETGDNAVLIAPWHAGRSGELAHEVGADAFVDPRRHFVVIVDPPGNGVSCSPSHEPERFPRLSIADMVESQRLLLESLGVRRLRAVVGTSMGGMQALLWGAIHPDRVERVVAIASTPHPTEADRARWSREIEAMRGRSRAARAASALAIGRWRDGLWHARRASEDWIAQAEAIASFDLAAMAGGSLEAVAARLPPTLLVVSARDPVLDPGPARALAAAAGAELLVLDGRCGHGAPACERATLAPAVARFIEGATAPDDPASGAPAP